MNQESSGEGSDTAKKKGKEVPNARKQAVLIWDELREQGRINKERFETLCRSHGVWGSATKANPSEWHRTVHAMFVVLDKLGYKIEFSKEDGALVLPQGLNLGLGGSSAFPQTETDEDKQHIGGLVAKFLRDSSVCDLEDSVFLGSGTTVYHVGLKMFEWCKMHGGPYRQLFSTINVPLAALWCCEAKDRPSDKVSIPRGVLETRTSRFETLQGDQAEKHRWTPAAAVVGADGCHYDKASGKIWLYAKSESIAYNTNLFVSSATTTVLYCLAQSKTTGRNNGPKLEPPTSDTVVRGVVTGKAPLSSEIREAFKNGGYTVVEKYEDFVKVKEANDKFAEANKQSQSK